MQSTVKVSSGWVLNCSKSRNCDPLGRLVFGVINPRNIYGHIISGRRVPCSAREWVFVHGNFHRLLTATLIKCEALYLLSRLIDVLWLYIPVTLRFHQGLTIAVNCATSPVWLFNEPPAQKVNIDYWGFLTHHASIVIFIVLIQHLGWLFEF